MATTVTKSIGSAGGRDYSTVQAWEDAITADLVAADEAWVGECYNDSEFAVAGTVVNIAGETTDATHTITLTTGTGQSFRDNANAQTNALRYNQSNGVGLRGTANYSNTVLVSANFVSLIGLQVQKGDAAGGGQRAISAGGTNFAVRYCIVECVGGYCITCGNINLTNCLVVQLKAGSSGLNTSGADASFVCVNNTIVMPSNLAAGGSWPIAIGYPSGTRNVKNCAMFGFNSVPTSGLSYTTCYTNVASPPTGCTTVAYDTSTGSGFQNITSATRDFRIKSGSAMLDVGTTDTTNAANDIVGTARPSGVGYDIGCWEFIQIPSRHIRLFEGFRVKVNSGRLMIFQKMALAIPSLAPSLRALFRRWPLRGAIPVRG